MSYSRSYMRWYRKNVEGKKCGCTRPAVDFKCGAPVCQHCLDLEKRGGWIHNDTAGEEEPKRGPVMDPCPIHCNIDGL